MRTRRERQFGSEEQVPQSACYDRMSLRGEISIGTGAPQVRESHMCIDLAAHPSFSSYHSALVSRFLLGFGETTFFPGALRRLSRWYFLMNCHVLFWDERYTHNELGLKMTIITRGSLVSNLFGSLVACGILSVMDGALSAPARS